MAKSTRSKWKKLHRRQKAKDEYKHTLERISHLHHKLELTAKGGISAIPTQEPEKRFHFVNPVQDTNVPNYVQGRNNNYTLYGDDQHGRIDFTKPLRLPAPKTNYYGKSNPEAPHRMTLEYERVDADTPLGGHAMTKADVERQLQKEAAAATTTVTTTTKTGNVTVNAEEDDLSEAPEEYVFGLDDAAPHKVKSSTAPASAGVKSKSPKKSAPKSVRNKATAKTSTMNTTKEVNPEEEEDDSDEDEEEEARDEHKLHAMKEKKATSNTSSTTPFKIASMQHASKKGNVIIAAKGTSKAKRIGTESNTSTPRVKRSTRSNVSGTKAKKSTSNNKPVKSAKK